MKKETIVSRLAFIKYLYDLGIQKSKEPEPFCWVSILNFHDVVELFLELAAEELGVTKRSKDLRFNEYWKDINPLLLKGGKKELSQRIQMDKLNDVRVAFKHHGVPPSKTAVEDARVNVVNFLEENTATVFGMTFSDISLIDIIDCESCRESLDAANKFLKEGKNDDALDKIALAFEELIDDYTTRKRDSWGHSPFFFGQDLTFIHNGLDSPEVVETVKSLQRAMRVMSLGIDYRKYSHFRLITSRAVLRFIGGKYEVQRMSRTTEPPTREDIDFCIDFVIESSVTLKEFDFEVRPKKHPNLKDAFS